MPVQELNGVHIHYDIAGEGEPLVFLNGVMMTTQSWVLQTSLFRQRYRCVLHDFRGQLLSDKPEEPWERSIAATWSAPPMEGRWA
jgi:pimeloyl-ACP methyl ester carboxylesterase